MLVQGDLEEEKCWMRRGGWGIGKQQDHRDERLDARTVLLCPFQARAVMELMKSPGLRRRLEVPEKHTGAGWGEVSAVFRQSCW